MFSWYKYLIVNLVFSQLGFWSGGLFLIAPFPDLCLLVPFQYSAEVLGYKRHRVTTHDVDSSADKFYLPLALFTPRMSGMK